MIPKIIVTTNVGSLGKSTNECTDANRTVRNNLVAALNKIFTTWGSNASILMIQECGGFQHSLPPFFNNRPISSNECVNYGGGDGDKRGVLNFADSWGSDFVHSDVQNEICVTISSYVNHKNKQIRFGSINIYRNQHEIYGRTSANTKKALFEVVKELRTKGVRNVIIAGDFNDEKFCMGGNFRELKDRRWAHRLNKHSTAKFIDKAFSNFAESGVLDILPTAENKESDDLGHKIAVIWVGSRPKAKKSIKKNICSLKKLKENCKEFVPDFMDMDPKHDNYDDPDFVESVAVNFTLEFKRVIDLSRVEVTFKLNRSNILMTRLEENSTAIAQGNKAAQPLYKYMKRIKEGAGEEDDSKKPALSALCRKLEDKLYDLHPENDEIAMEVLKFVFPVRTDKIGIWPKSKKDFRSLVLKVSNSGALDYMGMSLKMTKVGLSFNDKFLNRFMEIAKLAFRTGHFPKVWKWDQINFLYKRKGDQSDPSNWRPITISPSLGKHLERVMTNFMSGMNDMNDINHAYTAKRSCLTAILNLQKAVRDIKLKSTELEKLGYKLTPVVSTDDISGAFESVVHKYVATSVGNSLAGDERKIKELILSYLDRKCEAKDSGTEERYRIYRRFKSKTTPQGSLVSPKFWRIFDALFTKYYMVCVEKIVDGKRVLDSFFTVAYADDHVTVFAILTPISATEKEIAIIAKSALLTARELLSEATKTFGCKVHPTKSENVMPKKLHVECAELEGFKLQDSFVWLGYKLILTDEGEIVFDRDRIITKLVSISLLRDSVFQYTANITLKWKIFKTYIAPFIELYLPLAIQENVKQNQTILHKFQHDCLCKVLGVSFRSCRVKVEEAMGELSVKSKAIRLSKRMVLSRYAGDIEELIVKDAVGESQGPKTRSGKTRLSPEQIKKRDYKKWDYITKLANLSFEELEQKVKFNFDNKKMKAWAKKINENNQKAIRRRQDNITAAGRSRKKRKKRKSS